MRRRFLKNGSFFDYSKYMTIEVLEDGFTVRADRSVEYNVNGKGWNHLAAGLNTQPASKGDLLSFRCVLNIEEEFGSFKSNGKAVNLLGNVLSLIFGDSVETDISAYSRVFFNTFNGYSFPNIINIDKKFLSATTLASQCYYSMFYGCTSLTSAPVLPATTLADDCYHDMFRHCTSLVNAPELPATALADRCYMYMFYGCTSLVNAPELPATTLADNCYNRMFSGCINLNYIKMLATNISATGCLDYWVDGVSSTGTFVKSKDATWDVRGENGIPNGWTVKTDDEESGVNLISFTIKMNPFVPSMVNYQQQTYQAVEGMTWVEWCASEYNINGFTVVETEIGKRVVHNYDERVNDGVSSINANDIIISDGIYYYE